MSTVHIQILVEEHKILEEEHKILEMNASGGH
jgi:hypothetical protein